MKRLSFLSSSRVGLDIKPHSIRIIQLKKTRRGFSVENYATVELPADTFIEDKINDWDAVHSVLAPLVQTWGIEGAPTVIALPANLVRAKRMTLPAALSAGEIEAEIYAHVQQELPGMPDTLTIDFVVAAEKNSGTAEVFVTMTREVYLSQYIHCVTEAGLQIKIVDVDIYALTRSVAYALQLPMQHDQVIALCQLESTTIDLCVFSSQEIIFHQQWEMTSQLDLCTQLKRGMQLCFAAYPHLKIHELALCSDDDAISRFVMEEWQLSPVYPNPFARMALATQIDTEHFTSMTPYLLTACGLAMRELPRW